MYFSGGLIPSYLLVRNLGLYNTIWALVLPGAISTWNMLIVRNFFMALPLELEESARIDGASELTILLRIILPLSTPVMATIGLMTAVGHWNAWFDVMIYIPEMNKWTLQYFLRRLLITGTTQDLEALADTVFVNPESMKMATLMVTIIPIICIYPFAQKYFVKGIMIGSLKG